MLKPCFDITLLLAILKVETNDFYVWNLSEYDTRQPTRMQEMNVVVIHTHTNLGLLQGMMLHL